MKIKYSAGECGAVKSIIVSSSSSGGGKTTVALGLMKALKNRGFDVQGYKVGPDYIDTAFHEHITGKASRNLDVFLMGEDGVKASYSRGSGDYGIIEGVMGLYDGKGVTSEGSTAHVSKILNLPVIMVITPKAQSLTLCAEIKGLMDFEDVNITGVILNNIKEGYYRLLKTALEKNFAGRIKVFGYLPQDENLRLKSRHLGLVQSSEVENLDKKIERCSGLIEKYIDVDAVLNSFSETVKFNDFYHVENKNLKIGVAKDKAFSFYYKENLELMQEMGDIVYFSPLNDRELPENLDFIYIGGGYPEVFKNELSSNESMLSSIKDALNSGINCYAECGGFMYLMDTMEGENMVGFFRGNAHMSSKLQNFGYAQIEVEEKNLIFPRGIKINCHEFHKSYIDTDEKKIYKVVKKTYLSEYKKWRCGYVKNNTLAAYPHVHFFGNMNFLKYLTEINKRK